MSAFLDVTREAYVPYPMENCPLMLMWQNVLSNWLRIARMREVCARVSKDIGQTSRKWPKGDFKTVDERRVNICVERIDSQADVWEDERYAHQLRFYLGYRINIEYIITRNLVGNEAFCRA